MHEESSPKAKIAVYWSKIVAFLEAASEQRHVVALRDGMIGAVPVILVGSTFLLLGVQGDMLEYFGLEKTAFGLWYKKMAPLILIPFRYTMGLLSLYVSFTIAAALAKQYELPEIPNGLTSMATFLIAGEFLVGKMVVGPLDVDLEKLEAGKYLAAEPLGAKGLFLALIVGLLSVEVSRKLTFMPKGKSAVAGVRPAVIRAIASSLSMLACIAIMWGIRYGLDFDVHHFIEESTSGFMKFGDSYSAVFGVNVFLHLFGVAGVHGISVINAVMLPVWQQFLAINADAYEAGKALPYITAYPFYQWFIWIGGAGATLAPTLRCIRSKNAHVKKIGKVALVPGIFNVNEPLLFGLPVVANPLLAVPFIVAPLVCGTIAYFATSWGLVAKAFIEVPWVMPCIFGAYLSTKDVMAVVLLLVNIAVSYVIWSPFISGYERRLEAAASKSREDDLSKPEQQDTPVSSESSESESPPDSSE